MSDGMNAGISGQSDVTIFGAPHDMICSIHGIALTSILPAAGSVTGQLCILSLLIPMPMAMTIGVASQS